MANIWHLMNTPHCSVPYSSRAKLSMPSDLCAATDGFPQGYSHSEAQAAFDRAAHKNGWGPAPLAALPAPGLAAHGGRVELLPQLPQHWALSDALLGGHTVFVDLLANQVSSMVGCSCAWHTSTPAAGSDPPRRPAHGCALYPSPPFIHALSQSEAAEAELVLQKFQAQRGFLTRAQVAAVHRVQNMELWLRYCRCGRQRM